MALSQLKDILIKVQEEIMDNVLPKRLMIR